MKDWLGITTSRKKIIEHFENVYIQQWVCIDVLGETPTGHNIPYINDVSILTAYDLAKKEKEELVLEAISRGDHELFLLSPQDFRDQVINNIIIYPETNINTTVKKVDDVILEIVFTRDFFIKDYHRMNRFLPAKGVW